MRLTPRQEKFAQLVVQGLSQYDAYRQSYNCQNWKRESIDAKASELAHQNDKVVLRIEELLAKSTALAVKKLSLSREYVLDQLHKNALKAAQASPVLDGKGKPIGEYTFYPSAVNRAFELIGKELKMFAEQVEQRGVVLNLNISLSQLDQRIALMSPEDQVSFRLHAEALAAIASRYGG